MYVAAARPTLKDLNKFLTAFCGDWKAIGQKLGLSDAVLLVIASNKSDKIRDCFGETLHQWLQQDPNATWSKLQMAINKSSMQYQNMDVLPEASK